MKYILTLFLGFSYLGLMAQHNLYHWQLKGYTGIANYYNPDKSLSSYFKPEHNLWHQLEIGRSLGNTFGLSASAAFGKVSGLGPQGNSFTTAVRLTAAKLYFYTDNGWLLKPTSIVSPYFFGGYGLSTLTMSEKDASDESRYRQVVPFGMGIKFSLTERWQLDLKTEAVYSTKSPTNSLAGDQNKYNNGFVHTGLALAYNFGFKKSTFKAARFYATFPDTLALGSSPQPATSRNMPKLTKQPTLTTSPVNSLVYSRLDARQDTVLVARPHELHNSDALRFKRAAIQQSDTTSIDNRSRAIVRRSPTRQDTIWTATEKVTTERREYVKELNPETRQDALAREETLRKQEELRTDAAYRTAPRSTTSSYEPGSRPYESERAQLNPNAVVLLEKDRRYLEAANRENQQLRYTRDSLYTTIAKDTIWRQQLNQQDSALKALDDKTLKYMQQQATLNDSIGRQLAFYESELTRLQPLPASTPVVEPQPIGRFDTNVFFKINSYEVPSQSFNELLALANFLKANSNLKLQLTGYTDQTGKPNYNQELSRKRVEVIAAFFQEQGIEKERLFMQYFGAVKSEGLTPSLNRKVVLKTIN